MAGNKRNRMKAIVNPMKLSLANNHFHGRKKTKRREEEESNDGGKSDEEKIIKKRRKMNNNKKAMEKRIDDSRVSILDCSDILREVLSRLPIKSLMRFKCVSKYWQFLICQDQGLIDLHFARSKQRCPDLFIVVPRQRYGTEFDLYPCRKLRVRYGLGHATRNVRDRYKSGLIWKITKNAGVDCWYEYQRSILLANLFQSRTSVTAISNNTKVRRLEQKEAFYYTDILKPLNGLICFVDRSRPAVCILNPSTRERSPWVYSSLLRDESLDFKAEHDRGKWLPTYFFGFDPTTKQHKVICTWRVRKPVILPVGLCETNICEVLTVGDNTWRNIENARVPLFNYNLQVSSVYSNGFIYWGDTRYRIPEFLNAFDVGSEKFTVTKVPIEIRDKCMNPPAYHLDPSDNLIEVNGHIALLHRWTNTVVRLWICSDHASLGSYNKWSEVNMELPFQWDNALFHSVSGEDRVVIQSNPTMEESSNIKRTALYSYDLEKKTSTGKVEGGEVSNLVSDSLSSELGSVSLFTSFAQSLWPVRNRVEVLKTAISSLNSEISNLEAKSKAEIHVSAKVSAIEKTLATNKILLQAKEAELAAAAEG